MKLPKKLLSLLLCAVMVLGSVAIGGNGFAGVLDAFSVKASAEEVENSGTYGTNITWNLSDDGVLTISGTGNMPESYFSSDVPWLYSSIQIKTIVIVSGVTNIGELAFAGCDALTSITIPNSVTSICFNAFLGCTSLTKITVDPNNQYYSSDEYGVLFNKSKTELIKYPAGKVTIIYTIPDSVTSIDEYAFSGCCNLTSITIPNSVTSISDFAFSSCANISSITIPNSVTSIGDYAFYNCTSLTSVTIPDSVTSIGDYAFYNCTSLTSVTIPDSVTSIGNGAFVGTSIKEFNIPASVKKIGEYVFIMPQGDWDVEEHSSVLEQINVDGGNDSYSSENGVLFNKDKTKLIQYPSGNTSASYDIPYGVIEICDGAFYSSNISKVTIPDSVKSIGYSAFRCSNIQSITIPDSVTQIDDEAFAECHSLETVDMGNGVEVLGAGAFAVCNIWDIFLSDSLTEIPLGTFQRSGISNDVIIPDGVTKIGSYAFSGCWPDFIHIPSSVTEIDSSSIEPQFSCICSDTEDCYAKIFAEKNGYSFKICDGHCSTSGKCGDNLNWSLSDEGVLTISGIGNMWDYDSKNCAPWFTSRNLIKSVVIDNGVTGIGNYAFIRCFNCTSVAIPDSIISIGDSAFEHCTSLASVTIPDSVTSIDDWAFDGCSSLKDVFYSGSEADRNNITIGNYNADLLNAEWYYSKEDPVPDINPLHDTITNYSKYNGTSQGYRSSFLFKANIEEGQKATWLVIGADYFVTADGSCTVTEAKNDFTVNCVIKDENGKVISKDTETIKIKHGFFDKLIAFFRGLFRSLPNIVQ